MEDISILEVSSFLLFSSGKYYTIYFLNIDGSYRKNVRSLLNYCQCIHEVIRNKFESQSGLLSKINYLERLKIQDFFI